jgi:hypothetical protein
MQNLALKGPNLPPIISIRPVLMQGSGHSDGKGVAHLGPEVVQQQPQNHHTVKIAVEI